MLKNVEQIKLLLPSPFIQDCIYSEITFIKSAISRTDVHHFQKISIRCHNNVRKYTSAWCKIIIITGLIIYFFLQLDGNIPTIVYIIYLYFEFRLKCLSMSRVRSNNDIYCKGHLIWERIIISDGCNWGFFLYFQ